MFLSENKGWKLYRLLGCNAQGSEKRNVFKFEGNSFLPPKGTQWKYSYVGMNTLKELNRFEIEKNSLSVKVYLEDYPVVAINSLWEQIGAASNKIYVVQTSDEIVKRCILMALEQLHQLLNNGVGAGLPVILLEFQLLCLNKD